MAGLGLDAGSTGKRVEMVKYKVDKSYKVIWPSHCVEVKLFTIEKVLGS